MIKPYTHRQRGAALIVGLVLMMVMTVLAISTMRTSTLELVMAGNTQYRETARQLAEAGLADAVAQIDADLLDPAAVNQGIWNQGVIVDEMDAGSGDTYTVDIRWLYEDDPPIGGSRARADLKANFFELQSTGRTAARNARSVVRQGFWVYAD